MKSRPALFLDRDGVINKEKEYLYKIEDFEFIDGVFEACRYFQCLGCLLIVITNQAGIARGYYTERDFNDLNDWMVKQFRREEISIDHVYYCPHHPNGVVGQYSIDCNCRKPGSGMLFQAVEDYGVDLRRSILVGDKVSDIYAGRHAGVGRNILVTTGHVLTHKEKLEGDLVVNSLADLIKKS